MKEKQNISQRRYRIWVMILIIVITTMALLVMMKIQRSKKQVLDNQAPEVSENIALPHQDESKNKTNLEEIEPEKLQELYNLKIEDKTIPERIQQILKTEKDGTTIAQYLHGELENEKDPNIQTTLPIVLAGKDTEFTVFQGTSALPANFGVTWTSGEQEIRVISTLTNQDPQLVETYSTPTYLIRSNVLSGLRAYYFFIDDEYVLVYSDMNGDRIAPTSLNEILYIKGATAEDILNFIDEIYQVLPEFRATMFQFFER